MIVKIKFLFVIFIVSVKINVSNAIRCNKNIEVFSNQWCYRLLPLSDFFNCSDINCQFNRLVTLYTINPNLGGTYEFTSLRPPSVQDNGDTLWHKLLAISEFSNISTSIEARILISQFKLNESTFVQGYPVSSEHPNLLIHEDINNHGIVNRRKFKKIFSLSVLNW